MRINGVIRRMEPIEIPQEIIDQLEENAHHKPPYPGPTFGYRWKVKDLYKKGKLPGVKYDVSGRKLTAKNVTIDHAIPHSKGGPTSDENLMLATREFNQMRGNKPLFQFITWEDMMNWAKQFIDIDIEGFNGYKYIKNLFNNIRKHNNLG